MVSVETTVKVLKALREEEKFTRQLLEEFNDFSIHYVLKHCISKGFVRRAKKRRDKRVYHSLTGKGKDVLERYESVMDELLHSGQ